jgi:hypothetical protein
MRAIVCAEVTYIHSFIHLNYGASALNQLRITCNTGEACLELQMKERFTTSSKAASSARRREHNIEQTPPLVQGPV